MRSTSGLSPVISRSIQISRFGSCGMRAPRRMQGDIIAPRFVDHASRATPEGRADMAIPVFSTTFLVFLAASLGVRLWLAQRQIRCVRIHRDDVPSAFSARIGGAAHRKAADYTIARVRIEEVEATVDALALLALTLGGGIAVLARATGKLAAQALLADLALVGGAIALPFSWWRSFRLEARFGFNLCKVRRWLAEVAGAVLVTAVLGAPLVAAVLWLMGAAGALWWLDAWLVWVALQVA